MHVDSMIDRSDSPITIAATIRKGLRGATVGRAVAIATVCLIEGLLILGFVAASLGLGNEGHAGVGPDRPQPPAQIAPPLTR